MARLPRLCVPGFPHHLIQRGNNRQAIFATAEDYAAFLDMLREHAAKAKVAVHGYVLMSNHLHLLATPQEAEGLPQMMQGLGRQYVRYFNNRQQRSGTLWEGRYRSTVIQAERHLLACMVYMDLNPVRAGMVHAPAEYRWSSHRHFIGLNTEPWLTPHPLYWQLGNTPFAREAAYTALVNAGVSSSQQAELTSSAMRGWVLGEADYVADLQRRTERRLSAGQRGRPRREPVPN